MAQRAKASQLKFPCGAIGPTVEALRMLRASHILLAGEEEAVRVREEILAAGGGREAFAVGLLLPVKATSNSI